MQIKNKKGILALFALAAALTVALAAVPAATVSAAGSDEILWKDNFGGPVVDNFTGIASVPGGGYVAVGYSLEASFGSGNWSGATGKGDIDAIIVKFDAGGNVVWATNFGGSGEDRFYGVTATTDGGFVAVGHSEDTSFGNGDWFGISGKGNVDAIIVKFDANGSIVWATNFGGLGGDYFFDVTAVPGGELVAVGTSQDASFGNGNWLGATGKGNIDATFVKFNAGGSAVWTYNFGGSGEDYFYGVTEVSGGGFVAVGVSTDASFSTGSLLLNPGKGNADAIIVKFDATGSSVAGIYNFGGSGDEVFTGVTAASDGGFVAVGYAYDASLGTGDWTGLTEKGDIDATIVKFDADCVAEWGYNFGGPDRNYFEGVTTTSEGRFIAVGYSEATSFGEKDWSGVSGNGGEDAIAVEFDPDGNISSAKNFGGSATDLFTGVTAVPDGFVAVGCSNQFSFGNKDWSGFSGNGEDDAIIVKYGTFVLDITGVPSLTTAGTTLTLAGTVEPDNASNQTITWSVKDAGDTGATISGSTLSTPNAGTVVVTATIVDGKSAGTPFTKDFTITVMDSGSGGGGTNVLVWVAVGAIIAICAVIALVLLRRKGVI